MVCLDDSRGKTVFSKDEEHDDEPKEDADVSKENHIIRDSGPSVPMIKTGYDNQGDEEDAREQLDDSLASFVLRRRPCFSPGSQ